MQIHTQDFTAETNATSIIDELQERFVALGWRSTIWTINGFFILMTVIVGSLTTGGLRDRDGIVRYLSQFSLAEEKNLAASWEGWCLLLIAILAIDRLLHGDKAARSAKYAWFGLAALGIGLSFDELASIHERAAFLFSSWGLPGGMGSMIPLAMPALVILAATLYAMWGLPSRRCFWLTLGAFLVLGSVAFQEHLEHAVAWPSWARGLRFGVEEGTELFGIYLLLQVVAHGERAFAGGASLAVLVPRITTLVWLRPSVSLFALLTFVPLGFLTVWVIEDATYRGVPAAWLPFVLLSLAGMGAWACGEKAGTYREQFRLAACAALFFAVDQMIVFQRLLDQDLIRGNVGTLMFPCMAVLCMAIPTLRTRENMILIAVLLPLSLFFTLSWELIPWLVIPLQSLGIYWILTSVLVSIDSDNSKQESF